MRSKSTGSLFVVLTLVTAIVALTPSAFADHTKVEVTIASGASTPGCETTNSCFNPDEAIVDVGGEVTWKNSDTAAHTVTSGDLTKDPENVGTDFDSSLFGPGKTFSKTFDKEGSFPYFCQVHPWMIGVVTVQAAMAAGEEESHENENNVTAMSTDESTTVNVGSGKPMKGESLELDVDFTDSKGTAIQHQNYDIMATQDGVTVLDVKGGHTHTGSDTQMTNKLTSDGAVDVQITLKGVGLPDSNPSTWTGPKGDVVKVKVVPEFGTIAALILAISIVSIIAVSAKSRVFPKL